ncbi:hypothetical protein [Candidatus Steffania adelgidicola]|uniref:hypothetical protein n=1 Tax=Candidatus Steffania adelgidicola TaxID=1076626 RepID=UPI003B968333
MGILETRDIHTVTNEAQHQRQKWIHGTEGSFTAGWLVDDRNGVAYVCCPTGTLKVACRK